MAMAGALLSRLKLRLSEAVLAAASVCEATTFFAPSPAEKTTLAVHAELEQATVSGLMSPVRSTLKPSSQEPDTVRPKAVLVPAAGFKIAILGAVVSLTKVRVSELVFPAVSV